MNLEEYFKRLQRLAEQQKNQQPEDPQPKANKDDFSAAI